MDTITVNDFRELASTSSAPCVSFYLPTYPTGRDGQQGPIRLRNMLVQAEQQLALTETFQDDPRRFLRPGRVLLNDESFWRQQSNGLAGFIAPGLSRWFRLPQPFDEVVHVGNRLLLKGLLPVVAAGGHYYVLTLSQNNVRLFRGTRFAIEPVEVAGLEPRMAAALNYDQREKVGQYHSADRGLKGKQGAVFHGQGGTEDEAKQELAAYFRHVDAAVREPLRGEDAPLVLAGVEYLLPIYRRVNRYPHLVDVSLPGNWDHRGSDEIQRRSWQAVQHLFEQEREQAADKYRHLAGTGRATDDIRLALPAAADGRLEFLFVDAQARLWGSFDAQDRVVVEREDVRPGDDDLLELATIQTALHRGTVYAVERDKLPSAGSLAAVLRY